MRRRGREVSDAQPLAPSSSLPIHVARETKERKEGARSKEGKSVSQALVSNQTSSSVPLHADTYVIVEYHLHRCTTECHPWHPNFQLKITQVVFTPGLTTSY
ncbi:hypothetical protein U1Q18_014325 [Sarracenia purpurea var. burkii]